MFNRPIFFSAVILFSIVACSDPAASDTAKAKEHFMSEQQRVLEQAKEVQDLATEALEKQKKAMEAVRDQ